ncbi:MAG: hypothetical protein HUJ76_06495, partial [Parasporobacterium sp.]|nr:hypothetical protein [Parasporobacterium sp.]
WGYFDHCYVLNRGKGNSQVPDAAIYAESRGITMELYTSEPALQVYNGNPVGVCLESQMYPCAPNYPEFPSAFVKAGEKRTWKNSLKFIVR